ncbi:hypothetical protein THAOC_32609 [Thalassiosira oceanica]|uniref:Uncharacterized protein n=1 Tax=Thalassiosira oceanica TaxID=159749 RepID=K0R8U6_THAOC|nr:hypothetical protein THAOC_32609 [Thalassiosira oceanica]|eukprot:EJK48579.1 hypothetical protein THAOC_32609 [Thalassiosira oceanica]
MCTLYDEAGVSPSKKEAVVSAGRGLTTSRSPLSLCLAYLRVKDILKLPYIVGQAPHAAASRGYVPLLAIEKLVNFDRP